MAHEQNSGADPDRPAQSLAPRPALSPAVLCILDGWGYRRETDNNAAALASTPNLDQLFAQNPSALLETSGKSVGLPDGQMGNSEVGHMNLGSGRVVLQDLPKIDAAVASGALAQNPTLGTLVDTLKAAGGRAHLMGLLSPGGVHAHQDHIVALAEILSAAGIPVIIHAFLDGRDTPPSSARKFAAQVAENLSSLRNVRFGTVCGRYYAMDRDNRWDRVARAYDCLSAGTGRRADDLEKAIETSYQGGITDEFVEPCALGDYDGMRDGDALIMANFRADRAREILTALVDPAFDGFERTKTVSFSASVGMVSYSAALDDFMPCLFPPEQISQTLGEIVANTGLHQLRVAETEKYAHVTFFFNGGVEALFENEERILVPSPKVATYDLAPEMSAQEVTDKLVAAIGEKKHALIVCNYANPDMVGHTGVLPAAIKAMEAVDEAIGRLCKAVEGAGGVMLITADHGNLEQMADVENDSPHTAHTINRVPALLVNAPAGAGLSDGVLADVAPTMLELMGLDIPAEMTGVSLIDRGANADTGKQDNAAHA